jgi:hypothetical protein
VGGVSNSATQKVGGAHGRGLEGEEEVGGQGTREGGCANVCGVWWGGVLGEGSL